MGQPFSAVIVESHELFAVGLKNLLAKDRSRLRSRVFASFSVAYRELASASQLRLALIDVDAPGMDGASSTNLIRERFPGTRIILTAARTNRSDILECLSWAVHGVVLKTQSTSEIAGAIRLVMSGGVFVPPVACARRINGAIGCSLPRRPEASEADDEQLPGPAAASRGANPHLSARQTAVLRLLARGMSNKAIARELDLSEGTIKVHLAALYRALDVHNRASAISRMTSEGFGRIWHSCLLPTLLLDGFPIF